LPGTLVSALNAHKSLIPLPALSTCTCIYIP
jgi:hypothetical protein